MLLRQYSTDHRVSCCSSKQSLCSAASHGGEKTRFRVNSLNYFCDVRWMHACLHLCVVIKLFENHRARGHGEDEPWRWHHSLECNNKRCLVLAKTKDVCLRPLFSFPFFPRLVLWVESVTTQYTDFCFSGNTVSLCRSAEGWGGGGL